MTSFEINILLLIASCFILIIIFLYIIIKETNKQIFDLKEQNKKFDTRLKIAESVIRQQHHNIDQLYRKLKKAEKDK